MVGLVGDLSPCLTFVFQASKLKLFDAGHIWLVLAQKQNDTLQYIEEHFQLLNLSIDADIAVVSDDDNGKHE